MSRYKQLYKFNEQRLNEGYDYKDKILRKSLSTYLFNIPNIKGFVELLEKPVGIMYEGIKTYVNYFNYTVPKDSDMKL